MPLDVHLKEINEAGCDIVVAGTCIIKSENMKETIEKLKKIEYIN